MSDLDEPTVITPPKQEPSILDALRQDLKELSEIEEVHIPLIGWERTGLAAKYRLPESGRQLDELARKVMRETKDQYGRNINIALDTMVLLCVGLYVRPPDVEDYVELDPEESGIPMSFVDGDRLSSTFGWNGDKPDSARKAVRRLFANNDMAILNHAEKLNRWLQNTKANVETEVWQLGEV